MKLKKRIFIYIFLFIFVQLGAGFLTVFRATHPTKIESNLSPQDLNLPFEDILMQTKDGLSISGWFIPSPESTQSALIILHGYPAEKGDMLFIAERFHSAFNILLIDFRYFGESEGDFTSLGQKEVLDLEAGLDFLSKRGFGEIYVLGFSMGGAVAIMQGEKDERINAVTAYAPFADLGIIGKDAYARLPILRDVLLSLMKFYAKTFWDIETDNSPLRASRSFERPILLIHSRADEQIPFRHAELLKEALKENEKAKFYFLNEGFHGELPLDFEERIKKFFLKHSRE